MKSGALLRLGVVIVVGVVMGIAAVGRAVASDRFYRDCAATSPNGRYRLEAKSPQNTPEDGNAMPCGADFRYILVDTRTKERVWSRDQPKEEDSPDRLFVHDSGVVVVRTAFDDLMLLSADAGTKCASVSLTRAFTDEEHSKYFERTTARDIWAQRSEWYFLAEPAADGGAGRGLWFVVRPFWHRRLILDVRSSKLVDLERFGAAATETELDEAPAATRALLEACLAHERALARAALGAMNALVAEPKSREEFQVWDRLQTGLHSVAFLRLADEEPRLRLLEKRMGERMGELRVMRMMALTRQALRAIGRVPVPGYGHPFIELRGRPLGAVTKFVPSEVRAAAAAKVAVGVSARELSDLLGYPDQFVRARGNCYDYDIDGPEPFTLRVSLGFETGKVESVERIKPWAFLHDAARMRMPER